MKGEQKTMKHEELLKLTKDQLNARLKEIGASAKTAEGDVLAASISPRI